VAENVKAIGLFSGGLDSILAVKILQAQDIDVIGYAFVTPFFGPELALKSSKLVGIPLETWEITDRYMALLKAPQYGFGKNMNPCIDCHALMFRLAGQKMAAHGASFLFSGEVLGERPFSQTKGALRAVARLSGCGESIVRPLSAKLLEETPPEKAGWVDRARLEDIQGRSRKRQIELAAHFGIVDYPKPAGGCLLTEPHFSKRLRDLLQERPDPRHRDLELLKVGRHIRWGEDCKVIVGRREEENKRLEDLSDKGDLRLWVKGFPGPLVLLPAPPAPCPDALRFAAQVAVRYSDAPQGRVVEVHCTDGDSTQTLRAAACPEEDIRQRML
jgi:tRNA U34 2-thiouridine synthase MnmA/TrmU